MRKKAASFILLIVILSILAPGVVRGQPATIYVPDDYLTIQDAIDDCNDGDTIIVRDGTYTDTGRYYAIDFNGKAITLRSQNGPENCIINCEDEYRGFYFSSEDTDCIVEGFTITRGCSPSFGDGGGIYCYGGSPTIKNCIITNCLATYGGGIYCVYSSMTISNCVISNNSASYGGGICCSSDNGNGPIIKNCAISNNYSVYGGGICCQGFSSPLIQNCTINNNSHNGIASRSDLSPVVTNCTIVDNQALGWDNGCGIYSYYNDNPVIVKNCIIWGNLPNQIYTSEWYSRSPDLNYSDIQGGWQGNGNIDADPLFVDPTSGDYHLTWGSLCIDAGDPTGDYTGQTDIDGEPRVMNGRVDIGADEYSSSVSQSWSFDSDFQYNLDDNYATVEGTGHLQGTVTLSETTLSIDGKVTFDGPFPPENPMAFLIATDGADEKLAEQVINLDYCFYSEVSPGTYHFYATIPDVITPVNNGHYEVALLVPYGPEKYYQFFVNTSSQINSHYFPLIPNQPPTAHFTYSPLLEQFLSGQEITFKATEDERIASYHWTFKHGETEIGTEDGLVVHFRFGGVPNGSATYTIILTITGTTGLIDSSESDITVVPIEKKAEVVVEDILETGLSRIGARASYNWVRSEGGRDIFKISRIDSKSHYFVGVYVVSVENDSGVLWQKRLPATPLDRTYYPENLYVHASDWLRVTAYGVTEKEMLGLVSIAAGIVGLPTLPPGDVPFFYGSDTLYFAPDYIDTSDFPAIDVEDIEILPAIMGCLCSPGELRIYDSQGRVTGLLNGQVKEEIPDSAYFNGNFVILLPRDFYHYEVVGLEVATYDLPVISVEAEKFSVFGAADIPTSPNAVHQYTMDWDALSQGEAGATLKIDAEGDGVFERTIISNSKLTVCKIAIEPVGYELISQEQISETEFEYTFQILAKNSANQDIKDITFKLAEPPNNVSVIDGIAYFSLIKPGEEVLCDDTFELRSDENFDILEDEPVWEICNCFQRPRTDFSSDWYVDLLDLAEFTGQWLQPCSDPNWCQGTDLDRSTAVDFTDFAIFAKDWLWEIRFTGLDIDNDVDFSDYALFTNYWMNKNCAELAWCEGADFNKDGEVDLFDLAVFAEHWLEGVTP